MTARGRQRRSAGTPATATRVAAAPESLEGGWPQMPYTVYFPDGRGWRGADIEHPAPLPRIGDSVEYIDERGERHRYLVREVVHTLQTSFAGRGTVRSGSASPNALARTDDGPPEPPGGSGSLSAGLPEVFLSAVKAAPKRRAKRG